MNPDFSTFIAGVIVGSGLAVLLFRTWAAHRALAAAVDLPALRAALAEPPLEETQADRLARRAPTPAQSAAEQWADALERTSMSNGFRQPVRVTWDELRHNLPDVWAELSDKVKPAASASGPVIITYRSTLGPSGGRAWLHVADGRGNTAATHVLKVG